MADDLDFKLEGINLDDLDDKGKQLYAELEKQFKGAYTKRRQADSEERKKWDDEKAALAKEAEDLKGEVNRFNSWWQSLTPQQQLYYTQASTGEQRDITEQFGVSRPEDTATEYKAVMQEMGNLRLWGQRQFDSINKDVGGLKESMPLFMDLVDFRFKHPDADWKRVMERVKKEGIRNFDLAYQMEYGDELKKKEVEEQVSAKLSEELQKRETEKKLPEFTPGQPISSPEQPSKSWSDATAKFKESALGAVRKPA